MKKINTLRLLAPAFAVAVVAAASPAFAHDGPRVWLDTDASKKIVTHAGVYPFSAAAAYHPERVFAVEMGDPEDDDGGADYTTEFPGYEHLPSGAPLAGGTAFSYDVVAEPLWYDPATGPAAGPAAGTFRTLSQHFGATGTPRFAVENGLGQSVFSSTGLVPGDLAYRYNVEGDHGHLAYFLFGQDGGTTPGGADGIYALELRLRAPGLTTSDPYYLVFGKNADPTQLAQAAAVLRGTLVPEPAGLALAGLAVVALRRRRPAR